MDVVDVKDVKGTADRYIPTAGIATDAVIANKGLSFVNCYFFNGVNINVKRLYLFEQMDAETVETPSDPSLYFSCLTYCKSLP